MPVTTEDFAILVGRDLSAVTFVRDYLQLQFDPPPTTATLNALTQVTVRCNGRSAVTGDDAFPSLILGRINMYVSAVELHEEQALEITFTDGSSIAVSLRPENYVCAEALHLYQGQTAIII